MKQEVKDKIAAKFNFFLSGDNPYTSTAAFCQVAAEFGYNLAQEEYAAQSTQEGGTVEEVLDRIVVLPDHVKEDVLKAMSIVSATDKARIEELEKENANLKTVMIAAAEEIQEHWAAHCDEEGYGPVNLMHRLEKGIPSEYGYTAGRFDELKKEVERVGIMLVKAMGEVNDRDLEVERLRGLVEEAHLNGFKLSGEGWNGEYPFNDCKVEIKTDETYNAYWEQFKANNNL